MPTILEKYAVSRGLWAAKSPKWLVVYEDDRGQEKEVSIVASTLPRACAFVQEEYGDVLSIQSQQ